MAGKKDIVEQALKLVMGDADEPVSTGIRAYHSSPHDFDKFELSPRTSHTGEGAQSYGAGLYFAENPKVSGQGGEYWRQFLNKMKPGPEQSAAATLLGNRFDRDKALAQLDRSIKYHLDQGEPGRYGNGPDVELGHRLLADDYRSAMDMLQRGQIVGPRTYEVNINAHPDQFLDWDKPLSEQPEAVRKAFDPKFLSMTKDAYGNSGNSLHDAVADIHGKENVPKVMSEKGIPGIKYLDAGSRGAGDGTRNYVVFDDKLISIIRKYGIAGASAMLGL